MSNYESRKYLNIFLNNFVLIINLSILNIGLKTLTPTLRFYINTLSVIVYVLWIYFLLKKNEEWKIQITKINLLIGLFTITLFSISTITMFLELVKVNGVESVLKSYGRFSKAIYFLICFLQPIILPLPEPITITAGNVVFGKFIGFTLGFLGTVLGIVTMFFISRIANTKLKLTIINSKNLAKYNKLVKKNETFILILLFIFPILTDEIICIGAGLSRITFRKFLLTAVFSKFITVGLYSISSGLVKKILELGLIYQLVIVLAIITVLYVLKRIIHHVKSGNVSVF
ncbi:Uncharacterized membrane protein YdjX, TVP38/TMEM64 family, SNARE-associated domain [Proteiniclasticum ruminis]|uniref:TVP38/TMEM64 family membrane protein n=2 Tax=Proteiniclasticum ruminis TaxID=398199 RepID=A0A1I5EGW3_9CLOT|nr:Uncharacterized membrane protein YdjX, TVP38/TMEM64 family, SNARE-associated domain [Proteiniclasticum ruminis]